MAGHVRHRRVFTPPLAATGVLHMGDWFKDDLPDLLWPALVLAEQGNDAIQQFISWQRSVQDPLAGVDDLSSVAESLDGRLTHLSALAEKFPEVAELVVTEATRHDLLPDTVRKVLASYPDMPIPWLTGHDEAQAPDAIGLDLTRRALLGVLQDRHREALIKCLRTWSTMHADTFRADEETIDLLSRYPADDASRSRTDTDVRASWGAHKARTLVIEPDHFDEAIKWARMFWGFNSIASGCVRKGQSDGEAEGSDPDASSGTSVATTATPPPSEAPAEPAPAPAANGPKPGADLEGPARATPVPEDGAHLRRLTVDLLESFIEALESSTAHLYANERQEVVSGLVARAGRDLIAVLTAPDLWCLEHGAHIVRMLIETKIYLHWMAKQDPVVYQEFQAYGAGKAKLYARISDEVPPEARTAGFEEAIDEFERLSHNHDIIDHRTVDTRDTFAQGKSIRTMAEETGLLNLYRQAYSQASGVSHSEWWSIETHAMERCLNVLHGLHLIPSLTLNYGGNVALATAWVDQFHSLIRVAFRILRTDDEAVSAAFAWLDDADQDEPESAHD